MEKTIEHIEKCQSCRGTGLYIGMAERSGAAVVCYNCKGTGAFKFKHKYEEFDGRKRRDNVERVFEANPGFVIGTRNGELSLSDFGGQPYDNWLRGDPFSAGMEMRKYVCPAWWYQTADYDKKPDWDSCLGCGAFRDCLHFPTKEKCWERFDKENNNDQS